MKLLVPCILLAAVSLIRAEGDAVLGKIGGIELKTTELREHLAGLDSAKQTALARDPAALSQYVRALLIQRLVLKQAVEKKWDQEPAVISQIVRARESAIAESFLESASAPEPGYPTEAQVKDAYEANRSKLVIPKSYQLAQIYIATDGDKETAAKTKLDAITKQLAAKGADFAAIARTSSEEPASAAKDGEIGWLTEDQIQPEIREKLPKLSLHTVTDPIRLTDGWHILKVLDIREARTATLDEVRDELVTNLKVERSRIKRQEFIVELLKANPPAINEIEILKLP